MGLEEIIKNIDNETKLRVKQILDSADAEAAKIKAAAEAEAKAQVETSKLKADADSKLLVTRELSKANIEAKSIYQTAVNNSINESFNAMSAGMKDYMKSKDYQKLLETLANLAVSELGKDCTIFVQKADLEKLKKGELRVQEARESFMGGLRAVSKDQRMYVDYSLEKIIESLKGNAAVKLLKLVG